MPLALVPRRVAPTETPLLAVEGLPTVPVPGPGVARGEEDQEVLVVPHELVDVLAARRVVVLHGGVLVVAPGVGVDARALGVGLLEDRVQVHHRAADAGQVAAVVGLEAAVLDDQLGAGGHAVAGVVGEEVGEVVAGHGAGHVGAVVVGVPLVVADAAAALGRPQEVDGHDLALARVDGRAAVAGVGGRQAQGGVAEEAHVGIDAGVEDADGLALAEDPLAEDRRGLAAGEARLSHPDGGVVEQDAARLRRRSRRPRASCGERPRGSAAISDGVSSRRTRENRWPRPPAHHARARPGRPGSGGRPRAGRRPGRPGA